MLTTSQLRAARALIGMTVEDLSQASGVSADVIRSTEAAAGNVEPELGDRLRRVFEAHKVAFVAAGEHGASGPGVRLHQLQDDEGMRPQDLNSANDG
jgi:hypothetical protein